MFQKVIDQLDALKITYQLVEHEPAYTTEEADRYIEGIDGVRTKTMFLTDKKKRNFYLVILDDSKRLDMDYFKEIVDEKRIKMASAELLATKMQLQPGSVSPFGLLNNEEHDIQVYIDRAIINEERMSFHPNVNDKTIFIRTDDLYTFLKHNGYEVQIVDL